MHEVLSHCPARAARERSICLCADWRKAGRELMDAQAKLAQERSLRQAEAERGVAERTQRGAQLKKLEDEIGVKVQGLQQKVVEGNNQVGCQVPWR